MLPPRVFRPVLGIVQLLATLQESTDQIPCNTIDLAGSREFLSSVALAWLWLRSNRNVAHEQREFYTCTSHVKFTGRHFRYRR